VKKEEDVLTYIIYPAVAPAFLKGEKKPEPLPQKQAAAAASSPEVPSAMEVEVDGEVYSVRIISVAGAAVDEDRREHALPDEEHVVARAAVGEDRSLVCNSAFL
jgi:pyruvate carboxylase subunit B